MRTIAHRPVRRFVALVLLPTYLAGCYSWEAQEASPQQVLAEEQLDSVRVTLTDGSKLVLDVLAVSDDTLLGVERGAQRSIPLSDVSVLEVRKTETVLTAAAVLGGLALAAAAVFGIWVATCDDCLGT